MACTVCGHDAFHGASVSETFTVGGSLVVVERIPALVCNRCGKPNFAAEVAEHVRRLVHGPHEPTRTIRAEVLEYCAA